VINERFGLRVTAIGLPEQHEEKHNEKKDIEMQTEQEESEDYVAQEQVSQDGL
jgi:hypothetical protein